MFLFRGREIQGGYYRALISDLKNLPMLNISALEKETKQELIRIFSKYADTKFLSFPRQIEQEEKSHQTSQTNPEKSFTKGTKGTKGIKGIKGIKGTVLV